MSANERAIRARVEAMCVVTRGAGNGCGAFVWTPRQPARRVCGNQVAVRHVCMGSADPMGPRFGAVHPPFTVFFSRLPSRHTATTDPRPTSPIDKHTTTTWRNAKTSVSFFLCVAGCVCRKRPRCLTLPSLHHSVFNLCEGDDVAAAEAKLNAYVATNATSIAAHAAAAVEAVRAADAAATLTVEAEPSAGPSTSYAPTVAAAPAAALPMPTALPPAPAAGEMSEAARRAMGAASGWDPAAARKAGVWDALRTLFAL